MPIASRTFRVFVSSTFEDLIEERNALQHEVFPALSKLCQAHGARFQAIDLRWGVRDEAVLGQKMMEICLAEIERCQRTRIKPNFIVLLGDRYGKPPLPARVQAQEFEALLSSGNSDANRALMESWYQRDDNAVPAEYLLKPRTGELVDANRWKEVEDSLGAALRKAARTAGLTPDDLLKYEGSASHQEIVKGLGTTPEDRRHTFAFLRRTDGAKEASELTELKSFLRAQLGENAVEYKPGDIERLCRDVSVRLSRVILEEISRFESRTALELEVEAHDAFARERSRHFIGRSSVLSAITDYLKRNDGRPLVVHGPSGSGKSAVMAHASHDTDAIRRFIGATPESGNAVALLTGLCRQMSSVDAGLRLPELAAAFQHCLTQGTPEHPLVLFLDGVDQLNDVTWLPSRLPQHCRLVISTGEPMAGSRSFELTAMPPEEAGELLNRWLDAAQRRLNDEQRREVLRAFDGSGLPLYLKLAFEEARRWRSFDPPRLGEGIEGILGVMTARLSDDRDHGAVLTDRGLGYLTAARDGLAENEMIDLLSKDEHVWKDFIDRARHVPPQPRLPVIVWLRLLMDLEPYLVEVAVPGGTAVTWQHLLFRKWFAGRYGLKDTDFQPHKALAEYFGKEPEQPLWMRETPEGSRVPNYRKLRELAYQLTLARVDDELKATLGNLAFLEAKSFAEMEYDLLTDCERATAFIPVAGILNAALSRTVLALRARPDHILQTLYNHLAWIVGDFPALSGSLEQARDTLDRRGPWLQLESKPRYEPSARSVSYRMPFGSAVQAVVPEADLLAFARYDGRISAHRLSTGQELFTRSLLAGNVAGISLSVADRSVAYVDRNGMIGVEQNPLTLAGRRSEYLVFHDGRWVLATRNDHALVAWRAEDGYCAVLETAMPEPLSVLRPSALGNVLCVAGVREQKVGIIRMSADGCAYEAIPYQGSQILDAELDAAGERIVAACADRRIRILDASNGSEIRVLAYERLGMAPVIGRAERCCFGRGEMAGRAVFSTADAQIAAWDWETGKVEVILSDVPEGGLHAYYMLRGLDSGRVLATRLEDVALLAPSGPVRSGASHQRQVTSVDILDTGKVVSFSAADRSLVWHAADGGAPESWRNILNATAMTVLPGTSDVVVADTRGAVWKERPGGSPSPEGAFSTEGVVTLCAVGFGTVAVGAASGSILCVDPEANVARGVRSAVWGLRQIALTPAGRCGLCWTREVVTATGGTRGVLALVSHFGREKCKLRVEAHAVATGDHGSTLCYADASGVYVRRRRLLWFFSAYEKSVKASQLAVLGSSGLLAVTRADDNWLEIWRLTPGLPVVASAELPDSATCIAARGERVAIGFTSGEVLWFRLRKTVSNHDLLPPPER